MDKTPVELLAEANTALEAERKASAQLQAMVDQMQAKMTADSAKIVELEKSTASALADMGKAIDDLKAMTARATDAEEKVVALEKKLSNPAFGDVAGTKAKIDDAAAEAAQPKPDILAEFAKLTDPLARAKFVSEHKDALKDALTK